MKTLNRLFSNDLIRIAFIFAVNWLIWRGFFGWDGSSLLVSDDAVSHHFPTVSRIFSQDPLLPFEFGTGGGIALYPVTGILHPEYLLYRLGLDLFTAINFSMILIQSLATWHLIRFIGAWRRLIPTDWMFSVLLMGFAPVLIMRFRAGHVNFILSSLIVPLGIHFASIARKNLRLGFSELLISTYSLSLIFGYLPHQGIYYSILGLAPLLLFMLFYRRPWKESIRSMIPIIGIALVAMAWAFLELKSLFGFYASGEISRKIQDQMAIFSYLPPNLQLWQTTLFYGLDTISPEIPMWQHHELTYPFLSLFFALTVALFRSRLGLKILGFTMAPAIVLFFVSINTSGLTELMITLLPGFGSFRVIQRFMIPFVLLMSCLLILFARPKGNDRRSRFFMMAVALITAGALALKYGFRFSILIEMALAVFFFMTLRFPRWRPLALAFLIGFSFHASVERKPEYTARPSDKSPFKRIEGWSGNPLERVEFDASIGTSPNVGLTFSIPSLSFYSNPSGRFTSLISQFSHHDETYGMFFRFRKDRTPLFFNRLYNVTASVSRIDSRLVTTPDAPSHPVRFPTRIHSVPSSAIEPISKSETTMDDYILNTLDASLPESTIPEHCAHIVAKPVETSYRRISYSLEGTTQGCFAVIPLNYSTLYEVTGTRSGDPQELQLETFVSHKTLLGIRLGENTRSFTISPVGTLSAHSLRLEKWLGLALVFLLYLALRLGESVRRRIPDEAPDSTA